MSSIHKLKINPWVLRTCLSYMNDYPFCSDVIRKTLPSMYLHEPDVFRSVTIQQPFAIQGTFGYLKKFQDTDVDVPFLALPKELLSNSVIDFENTLLSFNFIRSDVFHFISDNTPYMGKVKVIQADMLSTQPFGRDSLFAQDVTALSRGIRSFKIKSNHVKGDKVRENWNSIPSIGVLPYYNE